MPRKVAVILFAMTAFFGSASPAFAEEVTAVELFEKQCALVRGQLVGGLCMCSLGDHRSLAAGRPVKLIQPFAEKCTAGELTDDEKSLSCDVLAVSEEAYRRASPGSRTVVERMQAMGLLDLSMSAAIAFPVVNDRMREQVQGLRDVLAAAAHPRASARGGAAAILNEAASDLRERSLQYIRGSLATVLPPELMAIPRLALDSGRWAVTLAPSEQAARRPFRERFTEAARTAARESRESVRSAVTAGVRGLGKGLLLGVGLEMTLWAAGIDPRHFEILGARPAHAASPSSFYESHPMAINESDYPARTRCGWVQSSDTLRAKVINQAMALEGLNRWRERVGRQQL